MSSLELFARNVRTLLERRGWRIRDLAERSGISGSYLSQVLNGNKKNVSDDYKDRIASALGVSLACLYSDSAIWDADHTQDICGSNPEREELKRIIDVLLTKTGLEESKTAFYSACGLLDRSEARVVSQFTANVLRALAPGTRNDRKEPLSPAQVCFLSYCWLAGSGAKVEWIKEICGLDIHAFTESIQSLCEMGYIRLVEESGITRVRIEHSVPSPPLSSLFTQRGLQTANLALATAMQVFPDEGPVFEARLGDVLVRAGRYSDALEHMQKAARMLEYLEHWYPAAELWQKAAVISRVVADGASRMRLICEAARCAAKTGDLELVESLGQRAINAAQSTKEPASSKAFIYISVGNALQNLDLRRALAWYKQGLSSIDERSRSYACLLVNIISVLYQMKMTSAAEQSLERLQHYIQSSEDLADVEHYRERFVMMRGLLCLQKHDWIGAREAFEQVIARSDGEQNGDVGVAWHSLGLLSYYEDRLQESRNYFASAERCFSALGLERQLEALYVDLAKVAVREGALEEAEEMLSRSEKSCHEQPWILMLRACIERSRGHTARAMALARGAIDGFRSRGFENELACAALWLSKVLSESGDLSGARFYENWAFSIYSRKRWNVKHLHIQCALLGNRPEPAK